MKSKVFLLLLLVGPIGASFIRENVVFKKNKDITTTRFRWLVAFEIDLTPYQTLIQNLNKHLADTAISVSTELLNYWQQERKDPGKYLRYENTISILNHEFENLNQTQIFLLTELQDIKSLHVDKQNERSKRSLIPIVGKALSFLFGTLSESDIETIQKNINTLAENQKHITHVLSESFGYEIVSRSNSRKQKKY